MNTCVPRVLVPHWSLYKFNNHRKLFSGSFRSIMISISVLAPISTIVAIAVIIIIWRRRRRRLADEKNQEAKNDLRSVSSHHLSYTVTNQYPSYIGDSRDLCEGESKGNSIYEKELDYERRRVSSLRHHNRRLSNGSRAVLYHMINDPDRQPITTLGYDPCEEDNRWRENQENSFMRERENERENERERGRTRPVLTRSKSISATV